MNTASASRLGHRLAPAQEAMVAAHDPQDRLGAQIEQLIIEPDEPLDLNCFQAAWEQVVARHAALRAQLVSEPAHGARQAFLPQPRIVWSAADWPPSSPESEAERWRAFLQADRAAGFDLARAPLHRCHAVRLASGRVRVVWTFHHLLLDGRSIALVMADWVATYRRRQRQRVDPAPAPPPFHQYLAWLEQWTAAHESAAQDYWRAQLAGFRVPTHPPFEPFLVEAAASHVLHDERLTLAAPERARLQELAEAVGVTLNTLVQAAWALVLRAHTPSEDVVFGAVRAGRHFPIAAAAGMVGMCMNTLPVRVRFAAGSTVRTLLTELRAQWLAARPFEHTPPAWVRQAAQVASGQGLYQSVVLFERYRWHEHLARVCGTPGWQFQLLERPPLPLTVAVRDGAALECQLLADSRFYSAETAACLARHLHAALSELPARLDAAPAQVALLDARERHQVLVDWNPTSVAYPADRSIPELFEAQVDRAPDALALVGGEQQLTYRELDERANQWAHHLLALGVKPETLVAVCLERSLEMAVAFLAVLKAGAAYLPLAPKTPAERLRFILADAQARVVLTAGPLAQGALPAGILLVDVTRDRPETSARPKPRPGGYRGGERLAYVIFTSGSTGQPKGVAVPHRGVVRLVHGQSYAVFGPGRRHSWLAAPAFDATTFELWAPLLHGGVCVIWPEGSLSFGTLAADLRKHRIQCLWLTAGLFNQIIDTCPQALSTVSHVLTGGEALSAVHVRRALAQLAHLRLTNCYGPTESTTFATTCDLHVGIRQSGNSIAIGKPLAHTRAYVLDEQLSPVPVGVPGELWLGGDGLARGYWNRPELTAERFVRDPFSAEPHARLYRTGDCCRWRADGTLECLGRLDQQVKVRGFRVELGEVEAALARLEGVQEAAVLARPSPDTSTGQGTGTMELAAFLVPRAGCRLDLVGGRERLGQWLPDYMIPARFAVVEKLPLTANGKVDRQALAQADSAQPIGPRAYVAPETEAERVLAEIWQRVLGVERVGRTDHFFELGGHSLLAMQVIGRLGQVLAPVAVRDFFEAPTLADLARRLDAERPARLAPLAPAPRTEPPPLSFAQERLWFLAAYEPESVAYHIPVAWRLSGPLELTVLKQALTELAARHEVLRTSFPNGTGTPFQAIAVPGSVEVPVADLSRLAPAEQEREWDRTVRLSLERPFDLARGPLWRVELYRLGPAEHRLLLNVHHIVFDGWSLAVFWRELSALYQAFAQGRPHSLAPLPVQYADFALWQRRWLAGGELDRQLAYWRRQLADLPALELPTDRVRPPQMTYRGAAHEFEFAPELAAALERFNQQEQVTPFMTLLAAFYVLLARYSRGADLAVGTFVANRQRAELEGLIGFFVNTLVLRVDLASDPGFRPLLAQVRRVVLEALEHQDLPFEKLVEELNPPRDLSRHPLFQVSCVVQNTPDHPVGWAGVSAVPQPLPICSTHLDLELHFWPRPGGWTGQLVYNIDLFEPETIRRLADGYLTLLSQLLAQPERPVALAPILPPAERRRLLVEWNATGADYPRHQCVPQLFEEQAARRPEAVAVVCGEARLNYRELNARAERLAQHLQALGVGPDVLVGLAAERSLEMVVGVLGILKAGGAYVPMDPAYPKERLRQMLLDAQSGLVLTQRHLAPVFDGLEARLLFLDEPAPVLPTSAPRPRLAPDHLAYVLFTSGSTGRPKGVEVAHRGLVSLLYNIRQRPGFTSEDVLLAVTTLSFDIASLELLLPLVSGGRLVVASREAARDGRELLALLEACQATVLQATPVTWRLLLDAGWKGSPRLMAFTGGEPCSPELATALCARTRAAWNLYGPTETTIYSTGTRLQPGLGPVPIGRPLPNTRTYIVSPGLEPLPVGVAGELLIGGVGVARGYRNLPEQTAARFIADPFCATPGERLYRTGDLARFLPDGSIECLGRLDHQVKIRGFRIELGEIESVLARHPGVQECAVVVRTNAAGDRELTGYVVSKPGSVLNAAELRQHLKLSLPDYMIPATWVWLERLPRTPNLKLDRKALPAPAPIAPDLKPDEDAVEASLLESELLALWRRLFGRADLTIQSHFFEVGGHSLLAARLVGEVEKLIGRRLPVAAIFQAPTVAGLARLLADRDWAPRWSSLVPLQPAGSRAPLFLVHGWGGNVFVFTQLARRLGVDQPAYGLQALGWEGGGRRHQTVEEMAAHYVGEMVALRPRGPYYLCGYSLGGLMAFEVARQLQARGHEIGLLAMLDTHPRTLPWPVFFRFHGPRLLRRSWLHLRWLVHPGHSGRLAYLRARLHDGVESLLKAQRLGRWSREIPSQTGPHLSSNGQTSDYFASIAYRYRLQRADFPILLFLAADAAPTLIPAWRWVARDRLRVQPVSGPHGELLTPEHLEEVAAVLRQHLAGAAVSH